MKPTYKQWLKAEESGHPLELPPDQERQFRERSLKGAIPIDPDIKSVTFRPMMIDENGNRSIFDDVDE